MRAELKVGLTVGLIGLVMNSCISALFGICGPAMAILAGAIAGFFAVRGESLESKQAGGRQGALTGLITGAFVFLGQILGSVVILSIAQGIDLPVFAEAVPRSGDPLPEVLGYWAGGLGFGVCLGAMDVLLSVLAGAGVGYLASRIAE